MKEGKPGKNRKPKSAKKKRRAKPAATSQPYPPAISLEKIMAQYSEHSKTSNPDQVGQEIVNLLDRLDKLSACEDPADLGRVIDRIVNHLAGILQRLDTGGNAGLKQMAQERMVDSARRFSEAAFGVIAQTPNETSKLMTLGLVKFIAGQCEKLKNACTDNPQTFRWIAEQNVFWPSIRGLFDSYHNGFPEVKEKLNLGGELPLNRERKKPLDLETAANLELLRFFGFLHEAPRADLETGLPLFSKDPGTLAQWKKVKPLPDLPPLSRKAEVMAQWKKCLNSYLELKICVWDKSEGKQVELQPNKERILNSDAFKNVRAWQKVGEGGEKPGVLWDQIKKVLHQALHTMAQP